MRAVARDARHAVVRDAVDVAQLHEPQGRELGHEVDEDCVVQLPAARQVDLQEIGARGILEVGATGARSARTNALHIM